MTDSRTVDAWLSAFERRDKKCVYIGGAVAALLVAGGLADKLFEATSPLFRAWFITSAILSGVLIGLCKIVFEQTATNLAKKKAGNIVSGSDQLPKDSDKLGYPSYYGPFLFGSGIFVLIVSAGILIAAAFFAAYAPQEPDKCIIQFDHKTHSIVCRPGD